MAALSPSSSSSTSDSASFSSLEFDSAPRCTADAPSTQALPSGDPSIQHHHRPAPPGPLPVDSTQRSPGSDSQKGPSAGIHDISASPPSGPCSGAPTNLSESGPRAGLATAPSRSWMSQRKGKAIHVGGDQQALQDNRLSDEANAWSSSPASAQRIRELGLIEQQLSTLLRLAGQSLSCLSPVAGSDGTDGDAQVTQFSASVAAYFETLNSISLGLRTSMSHLRAARISTRILFEPAHVVIPDCPVGLGNLDPTHELTAQLEGRHPGFSPKAQCLDSLMAEKNALEDLVESLEKLKERGGVAPAYSV